MANIATLIVGSWTTAGFTATNFNSLASGSGVLATSVTSNSTANEVHERVNVSFSFVLGGTTTANSFVSIYGLPLNQDGTTYGDGYASGASSPAPQYLLGVVAVPSGLTSGTTITGTLSLAPVPPNNCKFAIVNNLGVALNASAAAGVQYQFVDINNNG
jgi:hypothetical protein